ncbi:MAG: anti-sigma factor [Candidatus Dormibacteria bacterium]
MPHATDEVLSASVDGALEPAEADQLDRHLGECEVCRRRRDLLRATSQAVAALSDDPNPPALDLSFLEDAPVAPKVITVPTARWRPPAWMVPAAVAAALLIAAVGLGPSLLSNGGRSASTAAGSLGSAGLGPNAADRAPTVPGSTAPEATTARGAAAGAPANNGSLSGFAGSAPGSVTDASGLTLTLMPATTSTRTGQPTGLTLEARAGQAVALRRLSILVRGNGGSQIIAGESAVALAAGQSTVLSATWAAGQTSGPPRGGDYLLEGRATLADGRDVVVTVTVRVT